MGEDFPTSVVSEVATTPIGASSELAHIESLRLNERRSWVRRDC